MKQQVCILMKNSEFITFFSAVLLSSNVWIASVATLLYWYSIVETYKLGISKNRAEVSDIDSAQKVGIGPIGTTLIFLYMRTAVLWPFPVLVFSQYRIVDTDSLLIPYNGNVLRNASVFLIREKTFVRKHSRENIREWCIIK